MGRGTEESIFYFENKGPGNTEKALEIALEACGTKGIGKIVVASSTGETALRLHEKAQGAVEVIAVTYNAGSRFTKAVEAFKKNRESLASKGIRIVQGLHTFSGAERAFQDKYNTGLLPLNIVADTLRMFCQGMKVSVEIAVMAAEQGFLTPEEDVVVVAGSGHGADTAVVLRPAYGAGLFDTKFRAILCMPS